MTHSITNHRQLLLSLSKEQRAALTIKSNQAGLLHLVQHWGVILLLVAYIALGLPLWPIIMLPLGVMLVFQFTLLHEAVHYTPFASHRLNEWVAYICGCLLLLPVHWFRYFHLEHHRYTHLPDKDPELAAPEPQTISQYLLHVSGLPLWKSSVQTLWGNALGRCEAAYVPATKRDQIKLEARVMLLVYSVLLAGSLLMQSTLLLYIWVLPLLFGQPFLRLYLMAEHTGCEHEKNMLVNTRTMYTNRFVCWLAWNMPYHIEHHTYPSVPFYRLPELHGLMQEHLQVTERGYGRFQLKFLVELKREG